MMESLVELAVATGACSLAFLAGSVIKTGRTSRAAAKHSGPSPEQVLNRHGFCRLNHNDGNLGRVYYSEALATYAHVLAIPEATNLEFVSFTRSAHIVYTTNWNGDTGASGIFGRTVYAALPGASVDWHLQRHVGIASRLERNALESGVLPLPRCQPSIDGFRGLLSAYQHERFEAPVCRRVPPRSRWHVHYGVF